MSSRQSTEINHELVLIRWLECRIAETAARGNRMRFLVTTSIIWTACSCTVKAQTVIQNSNLGFSWSTSFEWDFGFTVWQDAPKTDYTGVAFHYSGSSVGLAALNADEGSDWYLVSPGNPFSKNTIGAGLHQPIATFNEYSYPPVIVGTGEFFLGVATNVGFSSYPPVRSVYGWVQLRPVNGILTMVENVMSYDSPGIIVGSMTLVPEPSAIAILGCGYGLLTLRRKKWL